MRDMRHGDAIVRATRIYLILRKHGQIQVLPRWIGWSAAYGEFCTGRGGANFDSFTINFFINLDLEVRNLKAIP